MSTSTTPRSVTVVGHGAAQGVPDVMQVDLGVECSARTVAEALADANSALFALTATLTANGVDQSDVSTTRLAVHPRYGEHGPDGAPIVGFVAAHSVRAVVRDVETAPALLGAAADAGGDAARIEQVSFTVSDDAALARTARDAAFADARSRAEQYAELAGATLGDVLSVSEKTGGSDSQPVYARMVAASSGPVPIQAGTQSVTAAVDVVYALV